MMKKIITLFLTFVILVALSSCSFGGNNMMLDNDQKTANYLFEKLLDALQSNDKDMLIKLFSINVFENIPNKQKVLEELFEYYTGEVESYDDWGGPVVETSKEDGVIIQVMESTYDVKTTECDYRFAIKRVTQDSSNSNNLGIHSIYIIKSSEDKYQDYAYWGDGKYTSGINIGVTNAI